MQRNDAGHGQYEMLVQITGLKSIYDTAREEDLDVARIKGGMMGLFCREGKAALMALNFDVNKIGGVLRFTDMFRSWDQQEQAHWDWKTGKKKAYSPPSGFSNHQGGRSWDIDIQLIDKTLRPDDMAKGGFDLFWEIARDHGFTGVMKNRYEPDITATEAWHFDYLGVFGEIRKRVNYKTAAMVAIMDAIGPDYQGYTADQVKNYRLQAYLMSYGYYTNNLDGMWGPGSKGALKAFLASGARSEAEAGSSHFHRVLASYGIVERDTQGPGF